MPIIFGSVASSFLQSTSGFESIQTVTVGSGGATSIDFNTIPQTYKHLQLRGVVNQVYGSNDSGWFGIQMNAGGGTVRRFLHWATGNTSTAYTDTANAFVATALSTSSATNVYCPFIVDILDYTNTNTTKTLRVIGGFEANGYGPIGTGTLYWSGTAAITSLSLLNTNGNWKQFSSVALYGIKAA